MGDDYTIQGISPLGTYGLGGVSSFGSYDYYMPSMMGMNGSVFDTTGTMMGMSPYSMYYNPSYYAQMQQSIESSALDHVANQHTKIKQNEVRAEKENVSAMVEKLLIQGDVQEQVSNLYRMVKKGDQVGICQEYDKLKDFVYSEFRDEFAGKGDYGNSRAEANRIIKKLYHEMVSANGSGDGDLETDIQKYGDGYLKNAFYKGFRRGHDTMYVDQTMNHIFGTRIDNESDHDIWAKTAEGIGRTGSVVTKAAVFAGVGAAGYTMATGASKIISMLAGKSSSLLKFSKGGLRWFALAGLVAGAAIDIVSQIKESKSKRAATAA